MPQTEPDISKETIMNTPVQKTIATNQPNVEQAKSVPAWIWTVSAFILGLLLSYILFGRQNKSEIKHNRAYFAKAAVKAAQQSDYKAVRDHLINWAKQAYPTTVITNLDDVKAQVSVAELKTQLDQLEKALYSPQKAEFSAEIFVKALQKEGKQQKKTAKATEPLPKLYK